MLKIIRDSFLELAGLPCWNVRQGQGSFLTFEFGKPELKNRKANPNSTSNSLRRDRFHLHGHHHLWIEQCEWEISAYAVQLAHSESDRHKIADAASKLAGRRLLHFGIAEKKRISKFTFEGGYLIEIAPYEDAPENLAMWHLYSPKIVLSYLDTGMLEYGPASANSGALAKRGDINLLIAIKD